jgi:hypothetical protein
MDKAKMSVGYQITCMECRTTVLLSKAIKLQYEFRNGVNFGFSGLGAISSGIWKADQRRVAELQQFLMLHRGHEIRVLSEAVERFPEVDGFLIIDPDTDEPECSEDFFFATISPPPDPAHEVDDYSPSLIEKLKRF